MALERPPNHRPCLFRPLVTSSSPQKTKTKKEHKYFDSADWALAKEGKQTEDDEDPSSLPPRTEPAAAHKLSGVSGLRP